MPSRTAGYALLVVEYNKPTRILTRIDVFDYVEGKDLKKAKGRQE